MATKKSAKKSAIGSEPNPSPHEAPGEARSHDDRTLEMQRDLTRLFEELRDRAAAELRYLGFHPHLHRPDNPDFGVIVRLTPINDDVCHRLEALDDAHLIEIRLSTLADHYADVIATLGAISTMSFEVGRSLYLGFQSGYLAGVCMTEDANLRSLKADRQLSRARRAKESASTDKRKWLAALMDGMAARYPDIRRRNTIAELVREDGKKNLSARSLVDAHKKFGAISIGKNGATDQPRQKKSRD